MIVLKILAVIIVIEAVAIMVLGIIRGIQELHYGHKEPEIVEPEGEPYTIDLSGLQPWDTENKITFHQDKPDGGLTAISEMISQSKDKGGEA